MANTQSIDTQTVTERIPLVATVNFDQRLRAICDSKGTAGYQLCGSFVEQGQLVLIFQLTR